MVIPPEEVGLKKARDAENNIIISYSTLHNILPPQRKNVTPDTRLCYRRASETFQVRWLIYDFRVGGRYSNLG